MRMKSQISPLIHAMEKLKIPTENVLLRREFREDVERQALVVEIQLRETLLLTEEVSNMWNPPSGRIVPPSFPPCLDQDSRGHIRHPPQLTW